MTIQAPTVPPETSVARPPRRPICMWPLRITSLVLALSVLAQPILAGAFLQGDYPALGQHGTIGSVLAGWMLLVIGSAVLAWRPGRYPFWLVPVTVALFFMIGLQIGMGHSRLLAVHIPLGVTIVASGVALCAWSWWPGRGRR